MILVLKKNRAVLSSSEQAGHYIIRIQGPTQGQLPHIVDTVCGSTRVGFGLFKGLAIIWQKELQ